MFAFVMFKLLLLWVTGRFYVLEQPRSSVVNYMPEMVAVLALTGAIMVNTDHGAFDDGSVKPLKLFGTPAWLPLIMRVASREETPKPRPKLFKSIGKKVYGCKSEMKESEHYCQEFGTAVALLQLMHAPYIRPHCRKGVQCQAGSYWLTT